MWLLLSTAFVYAESPPSPTPATPRVWLHGALLGGGGGNPDAGAPSALGGVAGGISARLGPDPKRSVGVVLHVGEGLASNTTRTVGTVDADVRWPAADGPYAFVGFAHHHETAIDLAIAHPVGATLATLPGIEHRTGFELGGGWDLPTPWLGIPFAERIRPVARLAVNVLPGTPGPPVYVFGELGLAVSVGHVDSAKP